MIENPSSPRSQFINILLVEDTVAAELRCRSLLGDGFRVYTARGAIECSSLIIEVESAGEPCHAIITDLTLEGGDFSEGLDLIKRIRHAHPEIPILVWTKHSDEVIKKALEAGANMGLKKYLNDEDLRETVRGMIKLEEKGR